ncbi:MAG TPA: peptide chain release factor N(5)-glutamine methyltransferase [Acetobacteraceae bacterium]|nr:peptide chain release factor N(5)-glutamine methyltransferase [Acetobacteraceae bacterium]
MTGRERRGAGRPPPPPDPLHRAADAPPLDAPKSGVFTAGPSSPGSPPFPHRRAALAWGADRLAAAGVYQPRLDARLLLAAALGVPATALLGDLAAPVPATSAYAALIARRAAREPVALILGRREFWSLDLAASPATLVPRPESETLIEAAKVAFAGRAAPARVLDLGTGTGCLLLAALTEFPAAFGVGIDRAPAAAALARENAARLGMGGRAAFVCGDWGAAIAGRFDLVLANPPYIPSADIPGLMPEVACHEPRAALDGGPDGLAAYRAIVAVLPGQLTPDGVAVLELGPDQAAPVTALAATTGLDATVRADLAGAPRALVLRPARP